MVPFIELLVPALPMLILDAFEYPALTVPVETAPAFETIALSTVLYALATLVTVPVTSPVAARIFVPS